MPQYPAMHLPQWLSGHDRSNTSQQQDESPHTGQLKRSLDSTPSPSSNEPPCSAPPWAKRARLDALPGTSDEHPGCDTEKWRQEMTYRDSGSNERAGQAEQHWRKAGAPATEGRLSTRDSAAPVWNADSEVAVADSVVHPYLDVVSGSSDGALEIRPDAVSGFQFQASAHEIPLHGDGNLDDPLLATSPEWQDNLQPFLAPTAQYTAADHERTRLLFKLPLGDVPTRIKVGGLLVHLFYHQIVAVAWMLSRHAVTCGGILGDDMGLGKTNTALVLLWANAVIAQMFDTVLEARQATDPSTPGILTDDGKHLRKGAPTGSVCPSSKDPHWPLQCVCEPNSISSQVAVSRGNALCVVPYSLLTTWLSSGRKLFDPFWQGLGRMILYTAHGLPNGFPLAASNMSHLGTGGTGTSTYWPSVAGRRPLPGQERNVIVTTPQSFNTHVLLPALKRKEQLFPESEGPSIWLGLIMVDEAHGECLETSELFTVVFGEGGLDLRVKPITWFLSGTPHPRGPSDILALLAHLSEQWKSNHCEPDARAHGVQMLCSTDAISDISRELCKIKYKFCGTEDPDLATYRALVRWPLRRFMAVLAEIMIRRTNETPRFSPESASALREGLPAQRLFSLPDLVVQTVHCSLSAEWLKLIEAYVDEATAAVSIRRAALTQGQQIDEAPLDKATSHHRRAVFAFPALLELEREGHFRSGWHIDAIKREGLYKAQNQHSPIFQHVHRLAASSPKLAILDDIITTMDDEDRATAADRARRKAATIASGDLDDDLLEDRLEQLVILTSIPMVAVTLAEVLRQTYPSREVGLFGSWMNGADRADIIRGFQKVRKPRRRFLNGRTARVARDSVGNIVYDSRCSPTILVGTSGTLAEGHTLHRARRIVVFEPQNSWDATLQGIKRVHRIGATRKCEATIIVGDYDPTDTLNLRRGRFDMLASEVLEGMRPHDLKDGASKSDGDVVDMLAVSHLD